MAALPLGNDDNNHGPSFMVTPPPMLPSPGKYRGMSLPEARSRVIISG